MKAAVLASQKAQAVAINVEKQFLNDEKQELEAAKGL